MIAGTFGGGAGVEDAPNGIAAKLPVEPGRRASLGETQRAGFRRPVSCATTWRRSEMDTRAFASDRAAHPGRREGRDSSRGPRARCSRSTARNSIKRRYEADGAHSRAGLRSVGKAPGFDDVRPGDDAGMAPHPRQLDRGRNLRESSSISSRSEYSVYLISWRAGLVDSAPTLPAHPSEIRVPPTQPDRFDRPGPRN